MPDRSRLISEQHSEALGGCLDEFKRLADAHEKTQQRLQDVERKLAQWETGAMTFRWVVIVSTGVITAGASIMDWARDHLK